MKDKGLSKGSKTTYEIIVPYKLKQFAKRLKKELKGIIGGNFIDEILKEIL